MRVGFGGGAAFNRASPSSHRRCVARIVADYVATVPAGPARILDVGGTARGFCAAGIDELPADAVVVIANPEQDVGADYAYVSDIPPQVEGFDLAMLFGVMMYLPPEPLVALLDDIRRRLRGNGTLLIAEPDPEGPLGRVEVAAKTVYALVKSLWAPTGFHFHTAEDTRRMLREAGFTRIEDRQDLTPLAMGVMPPPMPPYFVLAAGVQPV